MKAAKTRRGRRSKLSKSSVYAKVRREFSAADLQRYTETEPGIPADQLLAQMENIHRKSARKRSAS